MSAGRLGSRDLEKVREGLRNRLGAEMYRGVEAEWSEEAFNDLALEVFRYQVVANPVYGAFVRNRGIDPEALDDWRAIPAVPARAFKELDLIGGDPRLVQATFLTSGTTRGSERRGKHLVRDLSLYFASLLPMARAHLHPRGGGAVPTVAGGESQGGTHDPHDPIRVVSLLPDPEGRPESSLVRMAGALKAAWDDGGGGFYASRDWELDLRGLEAAIRGAEALGTPVLLLGTAFAFVHWLDAAAGGAEVHLPPGSVVMETGGYKGRSREVPRAELYAELSARLRIPVGRIVNEYGMTEMLSQFYEPVLSGAAPPQVEGRYHVGPPWVRTRLLDPGDLSEVPKGGRGLLCHLDLANLDSASMILTEDWGEEAGAGFRVLGRVAEAEPRGCSLSMEELLAARGGV